MGSYADSMLAKGEEVITRERQHWLALVLDSRMTLVLWAAAIALWLLRVFLHLDGLLAQIIDWGSIITLLAGLAVLTFRWLRWRAQEFVITNRRLVNVSGIVNKRSAASSLEKINDAVLEINLLGRILGYGDMDILTAAGDSGIDRYRMLRHAGAFKKAMLGAKHDLGLDSGDGLRRSRPAPQDGPEEASAGKAGSASPASYAAGGDDPLRADTPEEVTQLMERLTAMRDAGHLSTEEYAAKKQELLDRL